MTITVKTQAELDQALADGADGIVIDSPAGVWIYLSGSATVRASGSATVRAYDSATVSAYDSATVSAYDSATVSAYGSATVSATQYVAVHLHSKRVTLDGDGVVIDVTDIDWSDPATWCESRGIHVVDGIAYLYKAVDDKWTTERGTDYTPGATPEAPDWDPAPECGGGLHFCATPLDALGYHSGPRFVRVGVALGDLVVILPGWGGSRDKVKAPRVVDACVAVDIHGRVLDEVSA